MKAAALAHETDFDGWRLAARAFRRAGVAPAGAVFRVGNAVGGLFDGAPPSSAAEPDFAVPKAFVDLAREVILHRSADRFDLLYRL
ncbi:MAG: UdgX family uracil-DNA binding protein, partial [Brevundimonas sp.]